MLQMRKNSCINSPYRSSIHSYIFSFAIAALSKSEREDRYDIATQFDEVPPESEDGVEPVNVDQELAIERSLQHHEPPKKTQEEVFCFT